MADTRKRISAEDVRGILCSMRKRIETVPEEHRAILQDAIDNAEEQHERMRTMSRQIEDTVADLGLIVEHTRFHLAACRRELLHRNPAAHVPF